MKLSVVIPVFNEIATIESILKRVNAVDVQKEIIIVDDCSSDGTRDLLPKLSSHYDKLVLHDRNRGKGAALRTGFSHAGGDFVVVQDADLEYDPQDYLSLLRPVLQGKADVVYGSRFLGKAEQMRFANRTANRLLTLLTNLLFGASVSDMETCYKLIRTDIIKGMTIESDRFNFEPEITAKILRMGVAIHEVPISYRARKTEEGKKISWKDGVSAIWTLLKWRFRPLS
jgi:glycosyltransferase involved in cell wall biosynthesis